MASLKNGSKDILVATDVAGRGIDVRCVESELCLFIHLFSLSLVLWALIHPVWSSKRNVLIKSFIRATVIGHCCKFFRDVSLVLNYDMAKSIEGKTLNALCLS